MNQKDIDRFWIKVNKTDKCWEWTAAKRAHGYGSFYLDGVTQSAHRISYQIEHSKIPKGLSILHHCDNVTCVNPDHLYPGTQKQNMQDCVKRGRFRGGKGGGGSPGERHPRAKLTEKQVLEIRAKYASGEMKSRALAKAYGVAKTTIEGVIYRYNWKHI